MRRVPRVIPSLVLIRTKLNLGVLSSLLCKILPNRGIREVFTLILSNAHSLEEYLPSLIENQCPVYQENP